MPTEKPSAPRWTDSERPTEPTSPAARAALLVADWRACTAERQRALERFAARLAAASGRKVTAPR